MKKAILAASAAVAAFAMASSASATVVDPISIPAVPGFDAFSGVVTGNTGVFSDTFSFTLTGPFSAAANVTSITLSGIGDINFTSVMLDGIALMITNSGVTTSATTTAPIILTGSSHSLVVSGTGNGSYGGSIVVSAAVPEPATWAMMIAGIAAVGMTMRRRAQNVRVAFS
jgi:hypothetical protein